MMEEKEGYRTAGAYLVSMPVSNSRCGAWFFHLLRSTSAARTQPLAHFPHFEFEPLNVYNSLSVSPTLQVRDVLHSALPFLS